MKLNNFQIYQYANILTDIFNNKDIYIPVKANFILQKNIQTIRTAAQEIETARIAILKHYGDKDNNYTIPTDKIDSASEEFNNLFNIEQDLTIRTFKLEDLGNINLNSAQMQVLMLMISEEE